MTFLLPVSALMREKQAFQRQFYVPTPSGHEESRSGDTWNSLRSLGATSPRHETALCAVWLERTLKYISVLNYLSGLNFVLSSEGLEPIDYKNFEMASTLKGIKPELGWHPKQTVPLLPDMLKRIFEEFTSSDGGQGCSVASGQY